MPEAVAWRPIDDLARVVGHYSWIEHRIFEVAGAWSGHAAPPAGGDREAEVRVWCAAVSRRHAEVARSWAERLPVRAGIDAAALVAAPPGPLAAAFDDLGALDDPIAGAAVLAGTVLGCLDALYARHLETAAPVSEGPVAEVLVAARCALAGERSGAQGLLRGSQPGMQTVTGVTASLPDAFEQAFEEIGILPAVRPS